MQWILSPIKDKGESYSVTTPLSSDLPIDSAVAATGSQQPAAVPFLRFSVSVPLHRAQRAAVRRGRRVMETGQAIPLKPTLPSD